MIIVVFINPALQFSGLWALQCFSYLRIVTNISAIGHFRVTVNLIMKARLSAQSLFAFDEEERILIVSFLPESHSQVLWTSAAGIDRDARRFQRLGAILDWLCGKYSLDLMC